METLVEIYDDEMILNLITSLNLRPQKTIFLYEKDQEDKIHNKVIHRLIQNEIEYLLFEEETIIEELKKLDNVSFDIHGGNNLAITIVSQIAKEKNAPLYFPDLNKNIMYSIKDNELHSEDLIRPKLMVKDIIGLYGASVRNLPEVTFDEEGRHTVDKMMQIKRKNSKKWVTFTKLMSSLHKKHGLNSDWILDDSSFKLYKNIFQELREVFEYEENYKGKNRIRLINPDYLLLISDTGVAFEYDTYYQMVESGEFDDVDIRVNIDWNGEPFNHEDPNSELDVMATRNGRLISVSCKSGKYDQQAIYEVKANAVKFGGNSSISVLATDTEKDHPELVEKAKEMDVFLAEHKLMWNKTFVKELISWIDNKQHIM